MSTHRRVAGGLSKFSEKLEPDPRHREDNVLGKVVRLARLERAT